MPVIGGRKKSRGKETVRGEERKSPEVPKLGAFAILFAGRYGDGEIVPRCIDWDNPDFLVID